MDETLTLTELLHDPLTRLMMSTDGVSERDHCELWLRVKDTLVVRAISAGDVPDRR
jgi:hypothetical protein